MTLQPDLQTVTMHILPDISRSKGNQTVRFGQLIEYNKYFALKIMQKMSQGASSRPRFVLKL